MSGQRMMIKGTGPLELDAFIKDEYPDRYKEWLETLSPEAKKIYSGGILAFELYPLYDSLIEPTQKMCDLFYNGDIQGAWISGQYSAKYALKGFYKIFFRFGSPQFIIDRAAKVFSTYYPEGRIRVAESSSGRCVLQIYEFPEPYHLLELNIAGWLEGVLELLERKTRKVEITKSMAKGDAVTEFVATWA
ncbi:hypothetical protein JW906_11540 [bacterium]|nr:hypothetical protein [bacterium]